MSYSVSTRVTVKNLRQYKTFCVNTNKIYHCCSYNLTLTLKLNIKALYLTFPHLLTCLFIIIPADFESLNEEKPCNPTRDRCQNMYQYATASW